MKKHRNFLVGTIATICLTTVMPFSVLAGNIGDSKLPEKFISYTGWADTSYRNKNDYTSHYIMNNSGFDLWVISQNVDKKNLTVRGHAIVRGGEWFIYNKIKEKGFNSCRLHISTATSGTSGKLSGKWSPDSVGNYPVANP